MHQFFASWKLWMVAFFLGLLLLLTSAFFAVRTVAGVIQSTTRVGVQGFGGPEDALDAVTLCCRFSVLDWERQELIRWVAAQFLLPPAAAADEHGLGLVRQFFALSGSIANSQLAVNRALTADQKAVMLEGLRALQLEQRLEKPKAQRVMTEIIVQELRALGLAPPLLLQTDQVFPPVAFTIVRPPSVLVVSPRDRIKLERSIILQPGLSDQQSIRMEGDAEALGWSALVEPTGGYSTYPTIITDNAPLDFALSTAVHEWMHTYLFFRPLGFNYFKSQEMRTVNETVANIVGREVAKQILDTRFPSLPRQSPPTGDGKESFDFRKEMRATRVEAERLLGRGEVDEAERFMEERRQLFVRQGYNIRKLNQAYFAFHGTYADSPGSVSPVGPQLEQLLEHAGSVSRFVRSIEGVSSFEDYQRLLASYKITEGRP